MSTGKSNISGGKQLQGTAKPNDVRLGMTYPDGKELKTGTLDLSNLLPENIKQGITIDGVTGIYAGEPPLIFNNKILLTSNHYNSEKTYTVPSGVTKLGILLIGGGGGGNDTYDGEPPKYPDCDRSPVGRGGNGGRISKVIDVTPGQQIKYVVGKGGEEMQSGNITRFGTYVASGGSRGPLRGTGSSGGSSYDPQLPSIMFNDYNGYGKGGKNRHPGGQNEVQHYCSYAAGERGGNGIIVILY